MKNFRKVKKINGKTKGCSIYFHFISKVVLKITRSFEQSQMN
jgi:hypothetical protein